jgi:uncharacterized protein (TIGR02145 family)
MKTPTNSIFKSKIFVMGIFLAFVIPACNDDDPDPKKIEPGTVTDVEGNVYSTIKLGNQEWMAENLKTTKYRDGSNIELPGNDTLLWQQNSNGAYAWYNADQSNKNTYGALYNWNAVKNAKGLCPQGWRVPTRHDWSQMISYIANEFNLTNDINDVNAIGNKLKSCRMINSPLGGDCATSVHPRWNFHATAVGNDEFSFSALPGGNRGITGRYNSIGLYGFWWCSDEVNEVSAYRIYINYDQNRIFTSSSDKKYGQSVRCIKE